MEMVVVEVDRNIRATESISGIDKGKVQAQAEESYVSVRGFGNDCYVYSSA